MFRNNNTDRKCGEEESTYVIFYGKIKLFLEQIIILNKTNNFEKRIYYPFHNVLSIQFIRRLKVEDRDG